MSEKTNKVDRKTKTHFYFWNTIYSQWYSTLNQFKDEEGYVYNSAEKYMMMEKAKLFKDIEILEKMKNTNNVKKIKSLGRKISGFSEEVWNDNKMNIVTKGSYLKFSQNADLLEKMKEHKDLILVEGSPVDKIWGVGLHFDDDLILDENNWQGENNLGICLMRARNKLLQEI